jgi:predicted nucleotidyltransferase
MEAIAELCRAFGVKRLDLFGSATSDAFRPGASDVDLLVDFGDMGGRAKAHAYFALQDALREVFGTDVDLVTVAAVKNRYLASAIERTKRPLFAG